MFRTFGEGMIVILLVTLLASQIGLFQLPWFGVAHDVSKIVASSSLAVRQLEDKNAQLKSQLAEAQKDQTKLALLKEVGYTPKNEDVSVFQELFWMLIGSIWGVIGSSIYWQNRQKKKDERAFGLEKDQLKAENDDLKVQFAFEKGIAEGKILKKKSVQELHRDRKGRFKAKK